MNTLEQLALSQPLTDVYTAMETDLMIAIAEQLAANDGEINATSEWRLKKLAESGKLSRETARIIASYTGMQSDLLTETIENAAVGIVNRLEPALQAVATEGFISVQDSTPISSSVKNVITHFHGQAKTDLNLVNTVMQYKATQAYRDIVNKVYTESEANRNKRLSALGKYTLEVATGAESRTAAITKCIQEFARDGIPAFIDKAGREWSPEAYISMDIRTTVSNTANKAQEAVCGKYGVDLVQFTSHAGARPGCEPYQGRIYSRSGRYGMAYDGDGNQFPYAPLSTTSYGEPAGILGINCGHSWYPFIEGVSFRRYYPYNKEESEKKYKEFQTQRYLERRVRKTKRELEMLQLQKDVDKETIDRVKDVLKKQKAAYVKYSADHNLREHNDRLQVARMKEKVS